ncbi:MAG: class II fructose-bisphosphate aldolase, partial [Flavisolibacter sp.]|nr:class II fructose-bisphosphate aldolase [Flavisolibacter sp.]
MKKYKPGVLYGEELEALYKDAKENQFALPAVNTIGTNSINATLETAARVNSPVIIQFSNGGAQFIAGKGMPNDKLQANIAGGISGALHIHNVARHYGVPVVLHTDHASKKWLPWVSGLIDAGEQFYNEKGRPMFSSHMLDLSEEPIEDNIETSVQFFKRMAPLGMGIEIELGVTGGEEDGVDNRGVENERLYTQPREVAHAYEELKKVGTLFTIAAAFGNVHGVYSPGNVELRPEILSNSQQYIEQEYKTAPKPVFFVFHGGSGSPQHQIREAISYGAIKMNIDTDLQ